MLKEVNINGEIVKCDSGSYHIRIGKYVYARKAYSFGKGIIDDNNECRLNMRISDDEISKYLAYIGQSINDKIELCAMCGETVLIKNGTCIMCGWNCDESPSSYVIRQRLIKLNNEDDIFD